MENIHGTVIRKGWRLLTNEHVRDTHALATVHAPATLRFFDTVGQEALQFVYAMFDVVGFNITMMCLDVMHVLDLGVTQWLVASVFWALIQANFSGSTSADVGIRRLHNLYRLRAAFKESRQMLEA